MKTIEIDGINVKLSCRPLMGADFELATEGLEHIELMLNEGNKEGFVDCVVIIGGLTSGTFSIDWEVVE